MFFTEERIRTILNELNRYIYPDNEGISSYKMHQEFVEGGEQPGFDTSNWDTYNPGEIWGGRDKRYWFRTEIEVPARFEGKTVVYKMKTSAEGDWSTLNPQFLVYINGKPVQGLDVNHREVLLSESAKSGERYLIALKAHSGMKESRVEIDSKISVLDRNVEKLLYNIKVPFDVADLLNKEDKRRIDILEYLNNAINIIDLRKPLSKEFYESVEHANKYLEDEFYEKYCGHNEFKALCVGHTHIDVAWLWTLAETREKVARSFSTVLNLMKQYPEYVFMSSQPQLYKYIKEDHPEIYEEIKKRVKEGRWEPEGAMWLEADCNLSSGESLIRQVLFGTRFFEKEFGIRNKILWLPDVFGYSASLPQILKKSGIDYFMTSKISWNEYNKMPYDTFMWRGIDGTEILTYFVTTKEEYALSSHRTSYNGKIIPSQVLGAWTRYQQKDLNNEVLISFGHGDGGGGPTKEMLENAKRLEKGIPGCPRVEIGKSLDFFRRLEDAVSSNKRLPKWVGELYLEFHRGTYTSMARNKKFNRKSEFLFQDAEWLSIMNTSVADGVGYPQEKLNEGWETILLNQFHDILPGSSIKEVYDDSKNDYLRIMGTGNEIVNNAVEGISGKIGLSSTSTVVFNQLGFDRSDIVEFDLPKGYEGIEIFDYKGKKVPSQVVDKCLSADLNGRKVIFFAEDVPAKGYKAFTLKSAQKAESDATGLKASKEELSNKFFDIKLDNNMNIVSIFDKANGREVLKAGQKANTLLAFEDKPYAHDAWDISIYYQEKMWEINDVQSAEVLECGPVRSSLRITRKFEDSVFIQDIYVYNDIPRIDFANLVDWKERQVLVKTAFPVDVHTDKATYEIQFGSVERPTHWNTSWDYARFEVCAQKWADLSEDSYGVSLLNDCKYGHDIKDGVMRLSLIKSAVDPNPDADKEIHEFTYSLYPHAGDWKEAGTVQMAHSLNCPMYVKLEEAHPGNMAVEFSLVKVDKENVIIEVVKKAEDSDDIIVRVYECYNRRTTATLAFFKDLAWVKECGLMENNLSELEVKGNSFEFEIKPFEIKTFKVKLK